MSRYAANTSVSPEQSRLEIERVLQKYGATGFSYAWGDKGSSITFRAHGRFVKFILPNVTDEQAEKTPNGRRRWNDSAIESAKEQMTKQRWRALLLAIKAKLEIVETGISSFETEFMAHIVLPDGSTVGKWMEPQIAEAYGSGKMPLMLGSGI